MRLGRRALTLFVALLLLLGSPQAAYSTQDSLENEATVPSAFDPSSVLAELPGVLLVASTRHDPALTERTDRYRLYAVRGGEAVALNVPEERLGSISAVVSFDGSSLIVNAGGQVLYRVALADGPATWQIGDRLQPLSIFNIDFYDALALSPDGASLAVGRPTPAGLTLFTVSTGASRILAYVGTRPAYSPDGATIAFSHRPADLLSRSLFLLPANGRGEPSKVTPDADFEGAPSWLPDGSGIAYAAATFDGVWQARLWDFASETSTALVDAPEGFTVSEVVVSPDGAWVAYTLQDFFAAHYRTLVRSLADPSIVVELPQDEPWNDRVLGWAPAAPPVVPAEAVAIEPPAPGPEVVIEGPAPPGVLPAEVLVPAVQAPAPEPAPEAEAEPAE